MRTTKVGGRLFPLEVCNYLENGLPLCSESSGVGMRKEWFALISVLWVAGNSYADISAKQYAECAAIEGELERLVCFDELAKSRNLDGPQEEEVKLPANSKWDVSITTNPIDDTRKVVAVLKADEGRSKWNKPVMFVARCQSNETDVYIVWNDYLDGSVKTVISRIGKAQATEWAWRISTNSQSTFHPNPIQLLKDMTKADVFIAQTTPYNENPVTAIFDTTGIKEALKPLAKTCNWQLSTQDEGSNEQQESSIPEDAVKPQDDAEKSSEPSELVQKVQELLNEMGYDTRGVDGIVGPKTRSAVKEFQKDNDLAIEGGIDASTLSALKQKQASQVKPRHARYDEECLAADNPIQSRSCRILTRHMLEQGEQGRAQECYEEFKPDYERAVDECLFE